MEITVQIVGPTGVGVVVTKHATITEAGDIEDALNAAVAEFRSRYPDKPLLRDESESPFTIRFLSRISD